MRFEILNLASKDGDSICTSVELSERGDACQYFGTWYKANPTYAEVVGWCKERIAIYQNYIKNLDSLMKVSRVKMVEGMDKSELEEILAQMKEANQAPNNA